MTLEELSKIEVEEHRLWKEFQAACEPHRTLWLAASNKLKDARLEFAVEQRLADRIAADRRVA